MPISPGDEVTGLHGAYRVDEKHGQGSFGVTYRAREASTGRPVILKELRIERLDDWKALELFEREGRVLASLSHPNIPTFRDFFAHGAPRPLPVTAMGSYAGPERLSLILVQQFIEGTTLQARVDQGRPLPPHEAVQVLRSLLAALRHLHERSPPLIHRDIKPGNVILTPDGQPYLVDFGAIQDRLRDAASIGSTIVGTLGFMPLEQTRGQARPASDLYALGVTMIVAMTAKRPEDLPVDESTGTISVDRALPGHTPPELRETIRGMITLLVAQRTASAELALAELGRAADRAPAPAQIATFPLAPSYRHRPRQAEARHAHDSTQPRAMPRFTFDAEPSEAASPPSEQIVIPGVAGPPPAAIVAMSIVALMAAGGLVGLGMHRGGPRAAVGAFFRSVDTPPTLRSLSSTCSSTDHSGCYDLGGKLEHATPPDLARAVAAYQLACSPDATADARACWQLGWMYASGHGVAKDEARAIDSYKRGCDLGSGGACNNLGWRFFDGTRGVGKDPAAGLAAFKKSCDLSHVEGCDSYGFALLNAQGAPRDEAAALRLFQTSCDGGLAEACMNAGFMFLYGRATDVDSAKAGALWQRGCAGAGVKQMETRCARYDIQSEECAIAGLELTLGACGERDATRASTLLTKACADGWSWACHLPAPPTSPATTTPTPTPPTSQVGRRDAR